MANITVPELFAHNPNINTNCTNIIQGEVKKRSLFLNQIADANFYYCVLILGSLCCALTPNNGPSH